MSWMPQSRMVGNRKTDVTASSKEANKLEEFAQFLKNYPWKDLNVKELKNLRDRAIESGPQAIISLMKFLFDNVSQEKFVSLEISVIYSNLLNWTFAQEPIEKPHKDAIIFLTDPQVKQQLNSKDFPEQHIALINRCFAQNLLDLATFFICKFCDSINANKASEFLHEAFNQSNQIQEFRYFDHVAYILLQNKKINFDEIKKVLKTEAPVDFLFKRDCYKTVRYCLDDSSLNHTLFCVQQNMTLMELKTLLEKNADHQFLNIFENTNAVDTNLETKQTKDATNILWRNGSKGVYVGSESLTGEKSIEIETAEDYKNSML